MHCPHLPLDDVPEGVAVQAEEGAVGPHLLLLGQAEELLPAEDPELAGQRQVLPVELQLLAAAEPLPGAGVREGGQTELLQLQLLVNTIIPSKRLSIYSSHYLHEGHLRDRHLLPGGRLESVHVHAGEVDVAEVGDQDPALGCGDVRVVSSLLTLTLTGSNVMGLQSVSISATTDTLSRVCDSSLRLLSRGAGDWGRGVSALLRTTLCCGQVAGCVVRHAPTSFGGAFLR